MKRILNLILVITCLGFVAGCNSSGKSTGLAEQPTDPVEMAMVQGYRE